MEGWRKRVSEHLGVHISASVAKKLCDDVICLSCVIKRGVLLDYVALDVPSLDDLIKAILPQQNHQQMTVLTLNEDTFIVNKASLACSCTEKDSTESPLFVDITKTLAQPCIAKHPHTESNIKRHISRLLTSDISLCESSPLANEEPPASVTGLNYCSLYGWILGYPVIYWFVEDSGYDLDMEEIICCKVTVISKIIWQKVCTYSQFTCEYTTN